MNNQVNNEVSAEDILAVQASLLIPIIITIFCSALDIIFQLELTKVEIVSFKQGTFWVLTTLISYFFPSFFAGAITLFWQYYFAGGYSGIRKGRGFLLGMSIVVYLFFYIIYLLCSKKFLYTLFFALFNAVYAYFVITKCVDEKIIKKATTVPKTEVMNQPIKQ